MGGRGASGSSRQTSEQQKRKMNNITRSLAKDKTASNLAFVKNKDGSIGYSYQTTRIYSREKGGKMISSEKADTVERITKYSGRIMKDGLIIKNKEEKQETIKNRGREKKRRK